ncbi:MAG: hypothetical protein M0008_00980 [Actinomycetota bacterium]|jgi:hypothetical protein|nr:hypothetical protein [Actinomycetota bacterium]
MMALSTVQLGAAATEVLARNGYRQVPTPDDWPTASRLFEDEYGIVALHVYDTWQRLRDDWNIAQGLLVDLLSSKLDRPEPKAWEGYLVLFTSSPVADVDYRDIVDLRYNTNRLRKLVATGRELETVDDVRTSLLPLLPLHIERPASMARGILGRLPDLLDGAGVDRRVTEAAVAAFLGNESIMERLRELEPRP